MAECPSVYLYHIIFTYSSVDGYLGFGLAIQDELTTTKRSYEDQLSMMSDHLCSMNETLSKQREEIDTLKMSSKVGEGRVSLRSNS